MKATQRVHDANGKTVGFVGDDGSFYTLYSVLNELVVFENLVKVWGRLRSKHGSLSVITVKQFYAQRNEEQLKFWRNKAPFSRNIEKEFYTWYQTFSHMALYVRGARQVGKTSEILKFAYTNFDYVFYLNLADLQDLNWMKCWLRGRGSLSISSLCEYCMLPPCERGKRTVLIVDEIQTDVEIYNSIRRLLWQLQCCVIVTGSYLGVLAQDKRVFESVGSVYAATLYPMSFAEYCRVFNKEKMLLNVSIEGKSPESTYIELTDLYKQYLQVGGYPDVVMTYKHSRDFEACKAVLRNILSLFTSESMYYIKDMKVVTLLDAVMLAALELQLKEKKGVGRNYVELVTQLVKQSQKGLVPRDEVRDAITWLYNSRMLQGCGLFNDGDTTKPVTLDRLYFSDVGLANYVAQTSTFDQASIQGLVAETFVCCELRNICGFQGKIKTNTPFFSTYQQYELDFMLVTQDNDVYGLEVKSKHGTNPKSLEVFKQHKFINHAVVAEITRGGVGKNFRSIPIYTVATAFPYDA